MANGPTKDDLQDTVDQVGDLVSDALDPALSREEVIEKLQAIDDLLNGDGGDDDDDLDDNGDDDPEEQTRQRTPGTGQNATAPRPRSATSQRNARSAVRTGSW